MTSFARPSRVLWRIVAGVFALVLVLGVGPPALGHPYHITIVELTERNGAVEVVVSVAVEAFEDGTGVVVGPDPDAGDGAIDRVLVESVTVAGPDGHAWPLEVTGLEVRPWAGSLSLVGVLIASPPSGVVPDRVTLTYTLLVDTIPEHRVIVASGGEPIGGIQGDRTILDVPLGEPVADPVVSSAGVELDAAGVPGAIGDAVLGTGDAAVWVAVVAAVGLGAAHAFAPGHGKTLTAAYLVGSRGTRRHAVLLGLTTAVSHTIGVAVLGIVTLVAAETFDATRVYSVLGVASGLAITGIGAAMLWRIARRRSGAHTHAHLHVHTHQQGDPSVRHGASATGTLRWGSLAGLGLAGGMVPSASAVVLLLVALRFGRPGLGLALVGLFGLGMSAVLVGSGLVVLAADGAVRTVAARRWGATTLVRVSAVATPVAAAVVVIVGLVWTVQAVV